MHAALADLVELLTLERVESDLFLGRNEREGPARVFGGQVLAQALQAAAVTAPDRPPHSLHAYFLRPGDPKRPILFEVERVRDGRSFGTRRVRAIQGGEPIFAMSASFHVREDGLEHQAEPRDVPTPDRLEDDVLAARRLAGKDPNVMPWHARERAFEVRSVFPPGVEPPKDPIKPAWFRARSPLDGVDAELVALHECLLAYLSDMGLMSTSLVPHARSAPRDRIIGASLDHAMWFHRDLRVDDWILYDRDSPTSAASRGFNRGAFFTADGTLVASAAQESLIRLKRDRSSES